MSKALWLYGLTIAVWQSPLMKLSYPAHFPVKVTGTGEGTFILWVPRYSLIIKPLYVKVMALLGLWRKNNLAGSMFYF